jgi:hypothetical protein
MPNVENAGGGMSGGGRAPATPNPYSTAAAQQVANVEVAVANTALGNADMYGPEGAVTHEEFGPDIQTYTYDAAGAQVASRTFKRWKRTVTLSDAGTTAYELQEEMSVALNTWALAQIGIITDEQALPISLDGLTDRLTAPTAASIDTSAPSADALTMSIGSADLTAHIAATRDAIDERVQYQITVDREARVEALAHMGIVPGMIAYDRDVYAFDKASTDARLQAYLTAQQEQTRIIATEGQVGSFHNSAVAQKFEMDNQTIDRRNSRRLQAYQALRDAAQYIEELRARQLQEDITVRGHNVNEVVSLVHGGQINVPTFQAFQAGNIGQTPIADSIYRSSAMDMEKWQAKVKQQSDMMGAVVGSVGAIAGGFLAGPAGAKMAKNFIGGGP